MPPLPSPDAVEREIVQRLSQISRCSPRSISRQRTLFELGIDSLALLQILLSVEEDLDRELDAQASDAILGSATVSDLCDAVRQIVASVDGPPCLGGGRRS